MNGGGADQRYNLSFIVDQSVRIGKPIIGVSINYRLSLWGFTSSNELASEGALNIGLRDQRLALHWVQENIKAFGGTQMPTYLRTRLVLLLKLFQETQIKSQYLGSR
jgi:carboxylesterase type B